MKRNHWLIVGCLSLLVIANYVQRPRPLDLRDLLQNSDSCTLLSLDPKADPAKPTSKNKFYETPILGEAIISDANEKTALAENLFPWKDSEINPDHTHTPHYGIRAVRGSRKLDVSICFACQDVIFVLDGQVYEHQRISFDAKRLFNQILQQHHVALAKD